MTWKEENSVHLSLWLGMQGWRDQQGSALQANLEPGKHYWITRASISCRTTFLNSGLQCHLRTAPCVLFPLYGVFWTQLYNEQSFPHLQTLLRKSDLVLDSSLPLPDHHILSLLLSKDPCSLKAHTVQPV